MCNLLAAITSATCATYDASAVAYGELSEDYSKFPGLREEVIDFERQAPPGLPVLDIGCGGGRDARLLASLGRQVVGGDYAAEVLRWARDRSIEAEVQSSFVRLNALALPFRERSIAGVWASGSLLHLPLAGMNYALAEVRRVLVPGGIARISMRMGSGEGWRRGGSLKGDRWFTLMEPRQFVDRLEAAGFVHVSVRFVGRAGWFIAAVTR